MIHPEHGRMESRETRMNRELADAFALSLSQAVSENCNEVSYARNDSPVDKDENA